MLQTMKEIRLPQFGMGMTEGLITKWHKSVGDSMAEGELLCDIEAAKTTVEMQSPWRGTLAAILVPVDQSVPVNTCIALVEDGLSDADSRPGEAGPPSELPSAVPGAHDSSERIAVQVEPRARHVARAHHVDLAKIQGSGPGGRIIERDVRAFLAASGSKIDS
jgi:pyruvate dehydrogenase E2 component (dihydrolipoamide acetyltransferase)